MCLQQADGSTVCHLLQAAPPYNGQSLEILEHQLEDGGMEWNNGAVQAIANACKLSVDTYRDHLIYTRSEKVRHAVGHKSRDNLGYTFHFPSGYREFVTGNRHTLPTPIPNISSEVQTLLFTELPLLRYRNFRSAIRYGMPMKELEAYPEHREWVPQVEEDLQTRTQLTTYALHLVGARKFPSPDIYLPIGQAEQILFYQHGLNNVRNWWPGKTIIRSVLSPEDLAELTSFIREERRVTKLPRKSRRQKRRYAYNRHFHSAKFETWAQKMLRKYAQEFYARLRTEIPASFPTPNIQPLALAA